MLYSLALCRLNFMRRRSLKRIRNVSTPHDCFCFWNLNAGHIKSKIGERHQIVGFERKRHDLERVNLNTLSVRSKTWTSDFLGLLWRAAYTAPAYWQILHTPRKLLAGCWRFNWLLIKDCQSKQVILGVSSTWINFNCFVSHVCWKATLNWVN